MNREFLRMNPPSFSGLNTPEDPKNFIEELKNVFEVMHVADTERVYIVSYQLKGGRDEDAPDPSWLVSKKLCWD